MRQTETQDARGRGVICRQWRNTRGLLHRTTGPAEEHWTVLPGGARVLSYQAWALNGNWHREGRPAVHVWRVADDGTRVLVCEEWRRHGSWHRVGGPAYREWTVGPGGVRTMTWVSWSVNGQLDRVDGPAVGPHGYWSGFNWQGRVVRKEALPWLRRGRVCLAALTASPVPSAPQEVDCSAVPPAWSRDARIRIPPWCTTPVTYRSVSGGAVFLCV